jgi:hypothetical protein
MCKSKSVEMAIGQKDAMIYCLKCGHTMYRENPNYTKTDYDYTTRFTDNHKTMKQQIESLWDITLRG